MLRLSGGPQVSLGRWKRRPGHESNVKSAALSKTSTVCKVVARSAGVGAIVRSCGMFLSAI